MKFLFYCGKISLIEKLVVSLQVEIERALFFEKPVRKMNKTLTKHIKHLS